LRQFCVSYNIDVAYDNICTRRTSVHNIIIIYTQYLLYVYIMYIYNTPTRFDTRWRGPIGV